VSKADSLPSRRTQRDAAEIDFGLIVRFLELVNQGATARQRSGLVRHHPSEYDSPRSTIESVPEPRPTNIGLRPHAIDIPTTPD
jgi:hypothetical protein